MLEAWIAALAGLLIGSFLNVCIYRWPNDLSVVRPRSFCPNCRQPIAWFDNIPLLSYALLRGRCRHCQCQISIRYPLVELLTAASFFVAFRFLGPGAAAVKFSIFAAILITLFFADLEERILPDEFTIGGALAGIVLAAFVPMNWGFVRLLLVSLRNERAISVAESIFSAAFSAGTLWIVGALYQKLRHREGLGLGDVKMIAMIGAFTGLQGALLTLIVGSLLGTVVGLCYIWMAGKDASTYELPFGTFLSVAAFGVGFYLELALHTHGQFGR